MKNWTWVCVFMCVWVRRVKCIICFLKASKTRWGLTWSAKTWTCPLTWRSSSRARSCCPPTSKPGSSLWPSSRSVRDNEDEVFLKSDPSEVYNHVESTVLKLYLCYTICILRCALGALMLRCIWCHRVCSSHLQLVRMWPVKIPFFFLSIIRSCFASLPFSWSSKCTEFPYSWQSSLLHFSSNVNLSVPKRQKKNVWNLLRYKM